jgi:hypothetical protein
MPSNDIDRRRFCTQLVSLDLPARRPVATATTAATAVVATASTTAAATATAASTETTATATTTATSTAVFPWSGFIHRQVATVQFFAVELFDGRFGFFLGSHLYKAEATGTSSVAIFNDGCRLDSARLGKQLLQLFTRSLKRKVPNVEFCSHVDIPLLWSAKKLPIEVCFGVTAAAKTCVRVLLI